MKSIPALPFILLSVLAVGCQPAPPACPTPPVDAPVPAAAGVGVRPARTIEINHQPILMTQVVEGPLCNDTWSGNVYVSCGVRVRPWVEHPDFLEGCNLVIKPGSTVYVAAHNNTAFYNGCSCHTGEIP